MKKNLYAVLAVFSGAFTLGAFPLEWNLNNRTNVPYEVEINRTKLEKLAAISAKSSELLKLLNNPAFTPDETELDRLTAMSEELFDQQDELLRQE